MKILLLIFCFALKLSASGPNDFEVVGLLTIVNGDISVELWKNTVDFSKENAIKRFGQNGKENGVWVFLYKAERNHQNKIHATTTKRIRVSKGVLKYRINLIADQQAVYTISVSDFKSYITNNSKWDKKPAIIKVIRNGGSK